MQKNMHVSIPKQENAYISYANKLVNRKKMEIVIASLQRVMNFKGPLVFKWNLLLGFLVGILCLHDKTMLTYNIHFQLCKGLRGSKGKPSRSVPI